MFDFLVILRPDDLLAALFIGGSILYCLFILIRHGVISLWGKIKGDDNE